MCAYRALVPAEGRDTMVCNWLGPDRHLIAYPVGRGARYLNLVCVVPAADWRTESWVVPGDPAELRRHFRGWSPVVTGLLDQDTEPVYWWALYDREPLSSWTSAATAELGDSCHPMVPFLAQGAAQAIEDAAVLAECVGSVDLPVDLPAALLRYEHVRLPQKMSWANNVVYHLPDGPEQRARDQGHDQRSGFRPRCAELALRGRQAERMMEDSLP